MVFQQGETMCETVLVYNTLDVLFDPDYVKITVNDPDGTEMLAETSMTNTATGTYTYGYDIPTDATLGIWSIKMQSIYNSETVIKNDTFKVTEAI